MALENRPAEAVLVKHIPDRDYGCTARGYYAGPVPCLHGDQCGADPAVIARGRSGCHGLGPGTGACQRPPPPVPRCGWRRHQRRRHRCRVRHRGRRPAPGNRRRGRCRRRGAAARGRDDRKRRHRPEGRLRTIYPELVFEARLDGRPAPGRGAERRAVHSHLCSRSRSHSRLRLRPCIRIRIRLRLRLRPRSHPHSHLRSHSRTRPCIHPRSRFRATPAGCGSNA